MRKIFLCTTVTSKLQKSWSNIPFFLEKGLLDAGYNVKNIVLVQCWPISFFYNNFLRIIYRTLKFQTTYFYSRTKFNFIWMKLFGLYLFLISTPNDIILQQGFSYPVGSKKNKLILFGDWPYSYYFAKFSDRMPSKLEKESIKREDTVIESSHAIVTLFPDVYDYMRSRYQNKNIFYFGNVVNVDFKTDQDILETKINSKKILFIGREHYLPGALELVDAVKKMNRNGEICNLDIVGIPPKMIGEEYPWLTVHGYLDKDVHVDKEMYYKLLNDARVYVNTTEGWNAFQATLEAMYFYCPIVVRLNENLIKTFPNLNEFSYVTNRKVSLQDCLYQCLEDSEAYYRKAILSGNTAKLHTWENFIGKLSEKTFS